MGVNALQSLDIGVLPNPPPLSFLFHLPFSSSPSRFPLPPISSPLIQLEGLAECCKLHQWVRTSVTPAALTPMQIGHFRLTVQTG